jgi:SAM-dependent methyltransferase
MSHPIIARYNHKVAELWSMADLCTPWCIHVVATLRVAEQIKAGKGDISEIARAVGCDAWVLHRVLQHLVTKGVFEEPQEGRFRLNEMARGLLDPSLRIGLDLESFGGRMAHVWSTMLQYTRTGKPAYREVFGRPFWEDLAAHPSIAADFDALIGVVGHGRPDPHFDIVGGWDDVRSVVDVGGGTGGMIAEILRVRPHLRGILVDQSATVVRARETFREAGVTDRVSTVGQSFFDPLPPGADLYLLRGIINDWDDPEAVAILRRCAEAAGKRGRIVVLKGVEPDGTKRPLTVEMILAGGKHRWVSEFRELARQAGLEVTRAEKQKAYFVVECRAN